MQDFRGGHAIVEVEDDVVWINVWINVDGVCQFRLQAPDALQVKIKNKLIWQKLIPGRFYRVTLECSAKDKVCIFQQLDPLDQDIAEVTISEEPWVLGATDLEPIMDQDEAAKEYAMAGCGPKQSNPI